MVFRRRPRGRKFPRRKIQKRKLQLRNTALQPFPQKYITRMRYVETRTLTTGLNSVAYYNWNLNSVFDPNQTGVGHQPYGFDQLTPIYNRYRVIAVKYRIISTSNSSHILWAIPSNAGVAPADGNAVQENPRVKWRMSNPGAPAVPVNGRISLPSLTGLTSSQYMADDRYQSEVTTNPQESMILTTGVATPSNSASSIEVNMVVQLEYLVEFFDPKIVPQS